jgi:hypothetical protein
MFYPSLSLPGSHLLGLQRVAELDCSINIGRYYYGMPTYALWSIAALIAGVYCIVKAIADLRAQRYGWGIVGLLSAIVFLTTPVQTHAVKIDLPAARS